MMKKEILLIREYPRQVILFWLYLFVYKVCCFCLFFGIDNFFSFFYYHYYFYLFHRRLIPMDSFVFINSFKFGLSLLMVARD